MYIYAYVYVYVHAYVCIYMYMCICICMYIYIHICIPMHIHIDICIIRWKKSGVLWIVYFWSLTSDQHHVYLCNVHVSGVRKFTVIFWVVRLLQSALSGCDGASVCVPYLQSSNVEYFFHPDFWAAPLEIDFSIIERLVKTTALLTCICNAPLSNLGRHTLLIRLTFPSLSMELPGR